MRNNTLDKLRALAICLMIFQHVCLYFNNWTTFAFYVSRPAFPLFMMISGFLLSQTQRISNDRFFQIVSIGIVSEIARRYLGFPLVNILVTWSVSMLVYWFISRFMGSSYVFVLACVLVILPDPSAIYLEFGIAKTLFLLALGFNFGDLFLDFVNSESNFFSKLGRFPLTAYAGHFILLALLTNL